MPTSTFARFHSFCLNHIFRPCHLIAGYKNGFKVLTPESAEFEQHVAACVIDGPIDGESFLAYVEQVLVPRLKPGVRPT